MAYSKGEVVKTNRTGKEGKSCKSREREAGRERLTRNDRRATGSGDPVDEGPADLTRKETPVGREVLQGSREKSVCNVKGDKSWEPKKGQDEQEDQTDKKSGRKSWRERDNVGGGYGVFLKSQDGGILPNPKTTGVEKGKVARWRQKGAYF